MRNLKRVEIIANHSVEQEITDLLQARELLSHFTKIPSVHGQGNSEPKRGDHIWPEENFILIIYGSEEKAAAVEAAVEEVRSQFPNEGICCFVTG
ncbi:MAG: hypothetical protein CSA76_02580 [Spirochaetales bacterium]|nr:MAG: hypothetical protein CSA76_02580 [Spirochaetales bacterium]